jgi:hypothetical protein
MILTRERDAFIQLFRSQRAARQAREASGGT